MKMQTAKILNKFGTAGKLKIQVLVPEFRVSYPNVFQARNANPKDPNSKPKFGIRMMWYIKDDPSIMAFSSDLTILKQAVAEVRADKFGTDPKKWPKLALPFHKGDEDEDKAKKPELGSNVIYANANAQADRKPWLLAPDKSPLTDPNQFYPGCFATAKVTVYAYDGTLKKGVTFGLDSVMKLRDGDPLVGKSDPMDDFSSVPMPSGEVESAGVGAAAAAEVDPLGMP